MPLVFYKELSKSQKIAVWEITEPLIFFKKKISVNLDQTPNLKRQLEKVATAYLLDFLGGENLHNNLIYNADGKPVILNSEMSVSFSHSKSMIACIIDLDGKPVGIDIEQQRPQILKLAPKFTNQEDCLITKDNPILNSHFIWGAKEVLFKIWSKKEVDFKHDLIVCKELDTFLGIIKKFEPQKVFPINYLLINDFVLVYSY